MAPVLSGQECMVGDQEALERDALSLELRLLAMTFIGLSNQYKLSEDERTQEVLLEHICTLQFVCFLQTQKLGEQSEEYLDLLVGQAVDTLWDDQKYIAKTNDPKDRLAEEGRPFVPLRIRGLPVIESAENYKEVIGDFRRYLLQKRRQFLRARNGAEE